MADVHEFPSGHAADSLSCADVEDDHAAYAWGGLAPADRERVDRHRRECAACDQRILAAEQVVSDLDKAGPKMTPPPALRGRVLEAIAGLEQSPAATTSPGAGTPRALVPPSVRPRQEFSSGTHAEVPALLSGPRRSRETPVGRSGPRLVGPFFTGVATGVVGLAAAAALVVVLLVRPDALGSVGGPQSQFGSSDRPAAPPSITFPWQAPAASARLIELRSQSASERGLLAFDAQTKRGVLLVEGVASGADYGVWLVQGPQRVQVGILSVEAGGVGSFVLPEPLPLERPERIEVAPTGATA
ncbi:MAG: anti-sigma factor, partial [Chloroflexota bacterium]|nr:anti-sigma factor [Chloroflexota bacterium]